LRSAVVVGESPLRNNRLAALEAMECLVERRIDDHQLALGSLFDPFSDRVAVFGAPGERLENQNVECAVQEIAGVARHRVFHKQGWGKRRYQFTRPLSNRFQLGAQSVAYSSNHGANVRSTRAAARIDRFITRSSSAA